MDPISLALMAFGAIKQGISVYKEIKGTSKEALEIVDEIAGHLGGFFEHQEKAIEQINERKNNPPKGKSLQMIALENVLAQKRLEQAENELRELLIYQAPPELGAIWTPFIAERDRLRKEAAEKEEEEKKRYALKKEEKESFGIGGTLELWLQSLSLSFA